tara:strand:- start:474 stop:794 length:321 start_codon:yes stop_codon:yes gene_type:complete
MSAKPEVKDSNPPIRVEGLGRISSNWQTLGAIISLTALGTLAWAAITHEQQVLTTNVEAVKVRQDNVELKLSTQHDLLIRLGMNVDYIANGRRGNQPAPTVNNNPP